jgi:protein-L-isoaspartate O-methyltransferase
LLTQCIQRTPNHAGASVGVPFRLIGAWLGAADALVRQRKQENTLAEKIINKTMELSDLKSDRSREIIVELGDLIQNLRNKGLSISSWYGCFDLTGETTSFEVINRGYNYKSIEGVIDDRNFPWFLYWEIVWVTMNAEFTKAQKVLDLGGSSSLFSYYLASKGLDVTTVDLQKDLVENANRVAQQMGWTMTNHVMNMRNMSFSSQFDHITSICVYEHIPMYERININRTIADLLVPGGRFSITFDYKNPSRFARIETPLDVYAQFVEPSGLILRGNQAFVDTGQCYLLHPFYHPRTSWKSKLEEIRYGHFRPWDILKSKKDNDYTFGALFQEKP